MCAFFACARFSDVLNEGTISCHWSLHMLFSFTMIGQCHIACNSMPCCTLHCILRWLKLEIQLVVSKNAWAEQTDWDVINYPGGTSKYLVTRINEYFALENRFFFQFDLSISPRLLTKDIIIWFDYCVDLKHLPKLARLLLLAVYPSKVCKLQRWEGEDFSDYFSCSWSTGFDTHVDSRGRPTWADEACLLLCCKIWQNAAEQRRREG